MLWEVFDIVIEVVHEVLKQFIYPFEVLFRPRKIETQRKKDSLNEKIVKLVESLEKSQEIVFEITEDIKSKQESLITLNKEVDELNLYSKLKKNEVDLVLKQIETFDKKTSKKRAISSLIVNMVFLIVGCIIQYFISKYFH